MFALGCIQSRSCHTDTCPTGVATQDPNRQRALVVPDKATRVANFHELTIDALSEIVGAAGLQHPEQITADHIMVRGEGGQPLTLAATLPTVAKTALIDESAVGGLPEPFRSYWATARAQSFERHH